MEFIAYFASALIGISLGLIGGGGSILTIPVLVYLFGISPLLSTSYSLFIVGITSLIGAFNNMKQGFIHIKTALFFGLSSMSTVFLIRKLVIPLISNKVFIIGDFIVTINTITMILFAIIMVIAAIAMIKNKDNNLENSSTDQKKFHAARLLAFGFAIGIITGFLGAGGGFLLIPALVLLVGLPMKESVGTSLLIIALNSLIGFTGDLGHFPIDWFFLFKISSIAIVGIIMGSLISKKINADKLKKGFGWFVLLMGFYVIFHEVFIR